MQQHVNMDGPYSAHWTTRSHGSSPPPSGYGSPSHAGSSRYVPRSGMFPGSGAHSPGGRSSASGAVGCLTHVRLTAVAKMSRFLRRLVHFRHMDFEFAMWQMIYLLVRPQQVYRNFMYRKRTKDQWARDDPAFLVLLSMALAVSSMLFAIVLGLGFFGFIKFFMWVVFIDCIGVGMIVATLLWLLANNFLRRVKAPDQDVEWGYCFDVHLNAFFPLLTLLHVVMPLLYPLVIRDAGLFGRLIGNTIWFLAVAYYLYITFLGYTAMPNLRSTQIFLYPFSFIFIFYVATVTFGWNISQTAMDFYEFRSSTDT